VLLSCIIDAEEGRDVMTVDIPNVFIQTRVEDEKDQCVVQMCGVLIDILESIAPEHYTPYVTRDKNIVKSIILICLNAIYSAMIASLLYYRKFTNSIRTIGFETNPYDPCVANRLVNGSNRPSFIMSMTAN
jgi:hypothetical protein